MKMDFFDWVFAILVTFFLIFISVYAIIDGIQATHRIELVDEMTVDLNNMVYLDFTPEGTFYSGTPIKFTKSKELIKYLDVNMTYANHPRYFKIDKTYYCVVPNTLTYENYGER